MLGPLHLVLLAMAMEDAPVGRPDALATVEVEVGRPVLSVVPARWNHQCRGRWSRQACLRWSTLVCWLVGLLCACWAAVFRWAGALGRALFLKNASFFFSFFLGSDMTPSKIAKFGPHPKPTRDRGRRTFGAGGAGGARVGRQTSDVGRPRSQKADLGVLQIRKVRTP